MSHETLRKAAIIWLKRQEYDRNRAEPRGGGCCLIASEVVTSADDIPDAIGWTSYQGGSVLVECKASRADFLADRKKKQRLNGTGMGEWRYFFCAPGIVTVDDLPEGWGLIELQGRTAMVLRKAPHRELTLEGHRHEKRLLMSLVRRIRMREFLIVQPEQMDAVLEAGGE